MRRGRHHCLPHGCIALKLQGRLLNITALLLLLLPRLHWSGFYKVVLLLLLMMLVLLLIRRGPLSGGSAGRWCSRRLADAL